MAKEVSKQIYDLLKQNNFDVYFPSQHKGECISKYVVIKHDGVYQPLTVSSERPIYTIMCYVPEQNYSELESFVLDVKRTMKNIFPLVMYAGNETSSYYDDNIKSHMVSFQYYGVRKIENWNL
jgi:hypothetical protein